jgi:hypothetical protein
MWDMLKKMAKGLSGSQEREIAEDTALFIVKGKLTGLLDEVKEKALFQFSRILDIEHKESDWDSTERIYKTAFARHQVVLVNFIGPDRVLDGTHPAIIWDASNKNGHVVVIPLTSKKRDEFSYFDIGFVEGLILDTREGPKKSIVLMNQIQSVSRKSVQLFMKEDGSGPITLSSEQRIQIEDLFVRNYLGRKTTLRQVLQNIVKKIPDVDDMGWRADLDRTVIHIVFGQTIYYMLSDETWKQLRVLPLSVPLAKQKSLLRDVLLPDETIQGRAVKEIQRLVAVAEAAAHKEDESPKE